MYFLGGFGQVYKVKNKLDGGSYALKKISINLSNQLLYQKILREINFLYRLNHENVVRYFSSWIESESSDTSEDSDSSSSQSTNENITQIENRSINKVNFKIGSLEDDEYDFDEPEDIFRTSFIIPHHSISEDYVVFENASIQKRESSSTINDQGYEEKKNKISRHFMYIQMELCDCGTLKDAIDNGLYNNSQRKRRLFREIVEGLAHIHQQGMIHRDLKPGNIFLDSNDHVKIGDFGLATTEFMIIREESLDNFQKVHNELSNNLEPKYKLTGPVGTPLYVAPELIKNADVMSNKITYTQKVDIYSLGIILFEMSYHFKTAMERTKVILSLRRPEMIFPSDVEEHLTQMEIDLVGNLLQHDSSLRLSSSQLLDSEYLPGPEIEEREEQNIIRRAVLNPRNKIYKYMLNLLFQKEGRKVDDYAYDLINEGFGNFHSKRLFPSLTEKHRIFEYVNDLLEQIMKKHCAVPVEVPTFIPRYSMKKFHLTDVFLLLDHNGTIVSLPYNLRIPFARFVAKNKIHHLRRYSISKVYRQSKLSGNHPKELWECAFDIVTPKHINTNHLLPEAETICVLNSIVEEFPMLQSGKLVLKINHMKLIKAILSYSDIPENLYQTVFKIMSESTSISNKTQSISDDDSLSLFNRTHLKECLMSEKVLTEENKINTLLSLIEMEQDSAKKLILNLKSRMRKKGLIQQQSLELAKKALKEIETILSFVEKMTQFKFAIRISPGFILGSANYNLYSGVIFFLDREIKHKKSNKLISNIIAVGGQYDDLVSNYDFLENDSSKSKTFSRSAVGVSIEVEKIMRCVLENEYKNNLLFGERIDVVLCSLSGENSDFIAKELCAIVKELWSQKIKVYCFPEDFPKNIDDLHSFCLENYVRYAVVLKETFDSPSCNLHQITAKLIAYENERFIDKKGGNVSDIIDYLIKLLKSETQICPNSNTFEQNLLVRNDSNKTVNTLISNDSSLAVASNIKVNFMITGKMSSSGRRRQEGMIISHLAANLNFVINNAKIQVFALDLPYNVIKTIAGEIEFDDDNLDSKNVFEKSKISVMDKHPRHRKTISDVMDAVYSYKMDKKCYLIILISIADNMKFKILF